MKLVYRAFLICLIVFLIQCSKTAAFKPEIKLHLSAEPATLNPSAFEDGHALKVLSNLLDPLYENDSKGQLKPLSIAHVKLSPDGMTYTFTIKDHLFWSDGAAVTADDFVFGLEQAKNPALGGRQQDAYQAIESITAINKLEFVIRLKEPCSYLLKALTLPVSPLPKAWFTKNKAWSPNMPTNGPYQIKTYKKGQWIDLESNPYYGIASRKPKTASLRWVIVEEEQTALQLFKSGQLDVLTRVPGFEIKSLEKEGLLKKDPFAATFFIGFNLKQKPADSLEFRRAFTSAIEPANVVKVIESYDQPTTNWIPPGLDGHDYEPKKNLLVKPLKNKTEAVLSFDASQKNQTIAEFIQNEELKHSNIALTLSPADWKTHISKINSGATPIFRFARQTPFGDPIMMLDAFTTNSPNNKTGWSSKKYDTLVHQISTSLDIKKRRQLIHEALSILLDQERIIVPIYHYTQLHAVSKTISGFSVNPFSVIPLQELSLSKP